MMGRRVVIGAVAQSARSARQESSNRTTEQREASLSSGGGTFSNGDSADVLKAQIIEMERIRNEKSKAFRNINDITSTDLNDSERSLLKSTLLKGFISVLQGRIEIKYSYLKLLAIITFFCFYSISVILQRDISSSFGVQSRWVKKSHSLQPPLLVLSIKICKCKTVAQVDFLTPQRNIYKDSSKPACSLWRKGRYANLDWWWFNTAGQQLPQF